jgi:hypothetical protein
MEVEENRRTEEVEEGAGPCPLNRNLHMNPLEAIQLELDAQVGWALLQLECKFGQMHQYYLEHRNHITQNIWASGSLTAGTTRSCRR